MENIINEAKSTKVLYYKYYKEELDEFYQYPNFILLYLLYLNIKNTIGSFLDLFYRDRTPSIFFISEKKDIINYVKNKKKIEESRLSESNR